MLCARTILSSLEILEYSVFKTSPQRKHFYHSHFIDKAARSIRKLIDKGTKKGQVTCPGLQGTRARFESRQSISRAYAILTCMASLES